MNKKILKVSLVAIIVGAMFLYMSFMGAAGFGLALTGGNFKADFDSYGYTSGGITNGWQTGVGAGYTWGTPIINPAGQLEMNSPGGGFGRCASVTSQLASWPNQYTVEFRLKVDQFGDGFWTSNGVKVWPSVMISIYADSYFIPFKINATTLDAGNSQYFSVATDNGWHTWTLVCDHTGATYDVYRDGSKLTSFQYYVLTLTPKLSLDGFGGASTATIGATIVHFDWVYVDSGLTPPGGGGNPTGSISTYCTLDGSAKSGVSISDGSGSATTGADGRATISGVSYGTYSVTATLSGYTQQVHTGIVVSSGNPSADAGPFAFSSTPSTGSIYVDAQDQAGTPIRNTPCFVTVSGVASANAPHTFSSVAYGTYTVSATWKGEYQSTSVTVSSSNPNPSTTLHFSSNLDTSGGGGGGWDPLAGLRSFLNSFTIRNYELYAGAVTVLLGSILFPVALFAKKKTLAYVTAA